MCWTVRFWSAAPNRFADAMRPPHDLGFGERFGAYLPLVTHARNEYPCVPVPVFSVLCLGTWRVSCGCAPWRPRRERWFKRWGRYRRQFTGTAATPLITHRRFLALWDRQWTLTLHQPPFERSHRAASSQALLMLRAFSSDQCTASDSASALAPCIRVSMGSWAFMSLPWRVLACNRKCCATNDERREPAPGAVAWVAIGDSCGRSGGFFCVPCVRAATRAEAGSPGCRPYRYHAHQIYISSNTRPDIRTTPWWP